MHPTRPRILLMVEQASTFQHLLRTRATRSLHELGADVVVACLPGCEMDQAAQRSHPFIRQYVLNFKRRSGWKKWTYLLDKVCHALERDLLILDAPDCTLAQNRAFYQRQRGTNPHLRIFYARILHALGLRWHFFSRLAEHWGSYPELAALLDQVQPDAVLYCNCMVGQFDCLREAKRRKIPLILDLQNWDQATTKGPMSVLPDIALTWSEELRREFCRIHSFPREKTHAVGCVNFDVYFSPPGLIAREDFCQKYHIDPKSKILLYAYGKLQGLDMFDPIVNELYELVKDSRLGFPVHLLVRASPSVSLPPERDARPGLSFQKPLSRCRNGSKQWIPDEEEELERYSTLYHSDACVTNFSTMVLDAGCLEKPVINMGYAIVDGVRDASRIDRFLSYTHLRILEEPGVTSIPRTPEALRESIREFLLDSQKHLPERQWLLRTVCGHADANSHLRWAQAIWCHLTKETPKNPS